jgi:hypothetical protein
MRVELPAGLPEDERRAVLAALEQYEAAQRVRPAAWALGGRTEPLGLGALQVRHQAAEPWIVAARSGYTRRGTETRMGRGDTK